MRASERRQAIERELELTGRVDVASLARALLVSPVSIRRDLNDLVDRGQARRVYGGAVAIKQSPIRPSRPRPVPARRQGAVVGLVVPSSRYYYLSVLQGVKEAAAPRQARVALAVSGYSIEQEQAQIARLLERGVAALVITPAVVPERDAGTYELLAGLDLPVVLMERDGGDAYSRLDSVRSDHEFGARLAFQRLFDLGHRSVALVCAQRTATAGWLHSGLESRRSLFGPDGAQVLDIPSAPEYAPELVQRVDEVLDHFVEHGVTGALVHSDVAAGVLAQRALERDTPQLRDLHVIAYDDEIAALADPPLDAIAPPKHEVGRLALELALERAQSGPGSGAAVPRHVALSPALVTRSGIGSGQDDDEMVPDPEDRA